MKITITIEDHPDSVSVVSDPSFAQIMTNMTTREPTAAESYAMSALDKVREMSKQVEKLPVRSKPKLVEN